MFLAAAALRALLLAYGAWHDAHLEVKYTDIDYEVFSDGAALVWRGGSPFDRPTYRYTPLLALLLVPNVWGVISITCVCRNENGNDTNFCVITRGD